MAPGPYICFANFYETDSPGTLRGEPVWMVYKGGPEGMYADVTLIQDGWFCRRYDTPEDGEEGWEQHCRVKHHGHDVPPPLPPNVYSAPRYRSWRQGVTTRRQMRAITGRMDSMTISAPLPRVRPTFREEDIARAIRQLASGYRTADGPRIVSISDDEDDNTDRSPPSPPLPSPIVRPGRESSRTGISSSSAAAPPSTSSVDTRGVARPTSVRADKGAGERSRAGPLSSRAEPSSSRAEPSSSRKPVAHQPPAASTSRASSSARSTASSASGRRTIPWFLVKADGVQKFFIDAQLAHREMVEMHGRGLDAIMMTFSSHESLLSYIEREGADH